MNKLPEIVMWNKEDKEALEKAEMKMRTARIYLCSHMPFFGKMTLLLKLKASSDLPTMATDGQYLYYNPNFVNDVLTAPQVWGVVLHEVMHCAFLHLWRREKRNKVRFNCAADYAINPMVIAEGGQLPDGCLLDYKYEHMAAEKIYDLLPPPTKIKITIIRKSKDGKQTKEEVDADGDWFTDKKVWGKTRRSTKKKKGVKDQWKKQNKDLKGKTKAKTGKKKGQKLEDYWRGIFTSTLQGTDQGSLPAHLKRLWEEMQPKLNWKKLLANYLAQSNDDFDFMTPDRRFLDEDFYIPDIRSDENLQDVVVAVDTSGSISTWQFNHFVSEVKEIVKSFPQFKGHFINCDAEIHDIIEMDSDTEFKASYRGGGGTDFRPVFNKIKEKNWSPRVLVYLTDGYGTWPDKEPDFPVIWLIDSDVEPPFGYKVQYEYDEADKQEN